jgi:hypothetical protein
MKGCNDGFDSVVSGMTNFPAYKFECHFLMLASENIKSIESDMNKS